MSFQDAMPRAENGAAASVVLSTPPEWHALALASLEDTSWVRSHLASRLEESSGKGRSVSEALADVVGGIADAGIVFAAVCSPGEGMSLDFSTVMLALRDLAAEGAEDEGKGTHSGASSPAPGERDRTSRAQAESGPSLDAVMLPAGPASRLESFDMVELGEPFESIPVFCVEYGLRVPNDERVAVLTFTTIAPRDVDGLRAQFAEIASTLAFS